MGSGDILRATARVTSSNSPSAVDRSSVAAPGRPRGWARCHPRRAGQARPGRILPSAIGPGPCCRCWWRRPHPASSRLRCAADFPSHCFLPWLASGIAHQPLAMGRLPGCSSACWIAGPYRHCRLRGRAVGRVRAGTVAGGSPSAPYCLRVRRRGASDWSLLVRCPLGRHGVTVVADRQRRAAAPVTETPGRVRLVSWSEVKLTARSSREPRRAATVMFPGVSGPRH